MNITLRKTLLFWGAILLIAVGLGIAVFCIIAMFDHTFINNWSARLFYDWNRTNAEDLQQIASLLNLILSLVFAFSLASVAAGGYLIYCSRVNNEAFEEIFFRVQLLSGFMVLCCFPVGVALLTVMLLKDKKIIEKEPAETAEAGQTTEGEQTK